MFFTKTFIPRSLNAGNTSTPTLIHILVYHFGLRLRRDFLSKSTIPDSHQHRLSATFLHEILASSSPFAIRCIHLEHNSLRYYAIFSQKSQPIDTKIHQHHILKIFKSLISFPTIQTLSMTQCSFRLR